MTTPTGSGASWAADPREGVLLFPFLSRSSGRPGLTFRPARRWRRHQVGHSVDLSLPRQSGTTSVEVSPNMREKTVEIVLSMPVIVWYHGLITAFKGGTNSGV